MEDILEGVVLALFYAVCSGGGGDGDGDKINRVNNVDSEMSVDG
jgi:hypothetical protein